MRTPPVQVGQIVEVTIDRLAQGGAGIARFNEFVIFTPFTVPGDTAQIEIREVKKGYANAVLKKIIESSPQRTQAPCPYFGKCGGCDWQNMPYSFQLESKMELVNAALKKFHLQPNELLPILDSPKAFRYRNRIQLHHYKNHLGFKEARSHNILDIQDCLIAEEDVAREIKQLREQPSLAPGRIDIRRLKNGQISVTNLNEAEAELGFSQVNTEQNVRLIKTLSDWAHFIKTHNLLDLYSGSGNLTFPLHSALKPEHTIAVEANKQAYKEGQQQSQTRPEIEFINESVESFLSRFQKQHEKNYVVVLDPPRTGAGPLVMKKLFELRPEALFYVSCDIMTWARDVEVFLKNGSFSLKKVQPLDMFPQTAHIEIISMIVPT